MRYEIWQVDAFTTDPLCGNPAAVVFEAGTLSSSTMQAIARETNLSETAFITEVRGGSREYVVRFFGPRREVPFGGHPTVAAAQAVGMRAGWLDGRETCVITQHCGIGAVPIRVSWLDGYPLFTMRQAAPVITPVEVDSATLVEALGCERDRLGDTPPAVVSTGLPWLIVPLRSAQAVSELLPSADVIARLARTWDATGITTFALSGDGDEEPQVRVRTFAPGHGVPEDPVCGSGNGAVAAYIGRFLNQGRRSLHYVAEQGSEVHRPGKVFASWNGSGPSEPAVWIGGHAVVAVRGWIDLARSDEDVGMGRHQDSILADPPPPSH